MSESTTITVLDKLNPDTRYTITVVPVYAEGDGPSLSDSGKTSEFIQRLLILPRRGQQAVAEGADVNFWFGVSSQSLLGS